MGLKLIVVFVEIFKGYFSAVDVVLCTVRSMTTDPPPAEFEDVRIGNWQSRLPSAICANKEIFDEVFSLETWKTVLQPEQRDRILV